MGIYSDSDYAHDASDRRSVSGRVVMCGVAAVSWRFRTQRCVTLSSTEAEYVTLGEILNEALFVQEVFVIPVPGIQKSPTTVSEDNTCV